jgi:hypothetical protein
MVPGKGNLGAKKHPLIQPRLKAVFNPQATFGHSHQDFVHIGAHRMGSGINSAGLRNTHMEAKWAMPLKRSLCTSLPDVI